MKTYIFNLLKKLHKHFRVENLFTFKKVRRLFLIFFMTKIICIPLLLVTFVLLFFTSLSGLLLNCLIVVDGEDGDDSLPDWRILLACMVGTMVGHEVLVYVSYFHFASTELNAELLMKDEDLNRPFDELRDILMNKRKAIIAGYSEPYRLWCRTEMLVNNINTVTEIAEIKEKRKNEIL